MRIIFACALTLTLDHGGGKRRAAITTISSAVITSLRAEMLKVRKIATRS